MTLLLTISRGWNRLHHKLPNVRFGVYLFGTTGQHQYATTAGMGLDDVDQVRVFYQNSFIAMKVICRLFVFARIYGLDIVSLESRGPVFCVEGAMMTSSDGLRSSTCPLRT